MCVCVCVCVFFISLIADGPYSILPVLSKDLPISPRFTPYDFLSRCKFSTLRTRQRFTYSRFHTFRYGRKKTNSGDKNRMHDFRTSGCAGYLLDHSGDWGGKIRNFLRHFEYYRVLWVSPRDVDSSIANSYIFRVYEVVE